MLIIVGGPMFSGKTTWLINYLKKLTPGSFELYKPTIDTRYATDACMTHDGESIKAVNLDIHSPHFGSSERIKIILIDELNFFEPAPLIAAINKELARGKIVVGAGLLFDSNKKVFGATLALSKAAYQFVELTAKCDGCGKAARNSYRKVKAKEQVLLGAKESYGACCDECWEKLSAS